MVDYSVDRIWSCIGTVGQDSRWFRSRLLAGSLVRLERQQGPFVALQMVALGETIAK